ncbi:MAG: tyrosine--tRNA ligase [Saprospiraceae bacterium]
MDFIKELSWRGMLHDATPGLEDFLAEGATVGYIGFDPTAPSITIGNYVQIMLLTLLQKSGHRPIVLMGGATGRIGDPSGKDKERVLKSYEELDANLAHQIQQMKKLLDFDGPNGAILVNNIDFYKEMNVLEFLRKVGKTLTVNYMMSKDSVKNRLDSGLSFTEFSYQLLQAYDFQCLYEQYGCRLQMGGSDQWGNITSGTEFIRRNLTDAKAYACTTPLLTKADGTKFGKSEAGNIWLDPQLTSPYQFYQFWLNADDRDLPKFTRYFTLKSQEEVEALEAQFAEDPRALKALLAEELTVRVHSREDFEAVQQVSNLLFNNKAGADELLGLNAATLQMVAAEIPSFTIPKGKVTDGVALIDLMAETGMVASKSDARRAIKGNAVSVNKQKITAEDATVGASELLHGQYIMIENGKKNKCMVVLA